MELDATETTLALGDSATVYATAIYADGGVAAALRQWNVTAWVSPEGVISVDTATGQVTAIGGGKAVLTIAAVNPGYPGEAAAATLSFRVSLVGDNDGDGLPDAWESQHGLDPSNELDALLDTDSDALSNLREWELGTDPLDPDTDGDGDPDGLEVLVGTDPLVPEPGGGEPELSLANCWVSVLNRATRMRDGGGWVLPNVPSGFGLVRARVSCNDGPAPRHGQSDWFEVPIGGIVAAPPIDFEAPVVVPARLALTAPDPTLTTAGATTQLTALVTYPDASTGDVTADPATSYASSNPAIGTVSATGLVTAMASGAVIVNAIHDGTLGMVRIDVVLGGDSDGDGLPDDWELANGLDPNDPVDALIDADADGLANGAELGAGTDPNDPDSDDDRLGDGAEVLTWSTNPLLRDTDGDLVSDGLEVQATSDPLDPQSVNLGPILAALEVTPGQLDILVQAVYGEGSSQLAVRATLIDDTELDATGPPYGTIYDSNDYAVASFGAEPGRVYGGLAGTATVTVSNGPVAADVAVEVEVFTPTALATVPIQGPALDVVLYGDVAYVVSARLHVVDVANPDTPILVRRVPIPGNGRSAAIAGDRLFVGSKDGRVTEYDLAEPTNPQPVQTLPEAWQVLDELTVDPPLLFAGGYRIWPYDLSTVPPERLWRLSGPGFDLAADDGMLAAAAGTDGLALYAYGSSDVYEVGQAATTQSGDSAAVGVALRGGRAYVADGGKQNLGGLRVLAVGDDGATFLGSSTNSFILTDVALESRFALGADRFYFNAVPIFDVSGPVPGLRGILDFSGTGINADGNAIAVRNGLVFLAAERHLNGYLFIGRYALELPDSVPPTVAITSPTDDEALLERRWFTIEVEAFDETRLDRVILEVDGQRIDTDYAPPFGFTAQAPATAASVELRAIAVDQAGNEQSTPPRVIAVTPDDDPTVRLRNPPEGFTVIEGLSFPVDVDASDDLEVTAVELWVDGQLVDSSPQAPARFWVGTELGQSSVALVAVARDEVGQTATTDARVVTVLADGPPTVAFLAPDEGVQAAAGALLPVTVGARDDLAIAEVRLAAGGVDLGILDGPPYDRLVGLPAVPGAVELTATVTDSAGHEVIVTRTVEVVADSGTTVIGSLVDRLGLPQPGVAVDCNGVIGPTDVGGTFGLSGVPTANAGIVCLARVVDASTSVIRVAQAGPLPGVVGGTTDVGVLELVPALVVAGRGDQASPWSPQSLAYVDEGTGDLVAASDQQEHFACGLGFTASGQLLAGLARFNTEFRVAGAPPAPAQVTGGFPLESHLSWLDAATGEEVLELGGLFDDEGFEVHPLDLALELDGTAMTLGWSDDAGAALLRFQPGQSAATLVAPLTAYRTAGVEIAADGRVWVVREAGAAWRLDWIDPVAGSVLGTTTLASTGGRIGGVARNPGTRRLLVASGDAIFDLDPDAGTVTPWATGLDLAGSTAITALAVREAPTVEGITTLHGTITDGSGVPLEGVLVRTLGASGTTAPDGTFTLGPLATRTSALRVEATLGTSRAVSATAPVVDGGVTEVGSVVLE